jgi:hypothetical protein
MKKAKEAANEVIAAFAPPGSDAQSVTAAKDTARALSDAYLVELIDEMDAKVVPERTKRTEQGLVSIVREFDARWKGFVHRVSAASPEGFVEGLADQFKAKAGEVVGDKLFEATWAPPVKAAAEKTDGQSGKGHKGKGGQNRRTDKTATAAR